MNQWKNIVVKSQYMCTEERMEQIREKAYHLKAKREAERQEYVKKCCDRQWRDACDEARKLGSKARLDKLMNDRKHFVVNKEAKWKESREDGKTRDLELPTCRTGYVYMLVSLRRWSYTYIGQTICIGQRIKQHNSGYGAMGTCDERLKPFALIGYICGFDGKRQLREHVEYMWKLERDKLVMNGIEDVTVLARIGAQRVIQQLDTNMYGIDRTDLSFVSLFRNN